MNQSSSYIATKERVQLVNYLDKLGETDLAQEIITGLQSTPKQIPSKFFYDTKGSLLFEEITRLDEYYPSRTERSILKEIAPKIFRNLKDTDIIELGSGDGSKMLILLNELLEHNQEGITYIPVDFSQSAVEKSIRFLSGAFPSLSFMGITADFLSQVHLIPRNRRRLICFLGSTLGNLNRDDAFKFLSNVRNAMGKGDELLLGIDMVKELDVLSKAYNDSKWVTAAFNKNILNVSNQIAKTNFNPNDFEHLAYFNVEHSRVEMHLKAVRNLDVISPLIMQPISILRDETIHTENSHKYTVQAIENLVDLSGLRIRDIYTDPNHWFSVLHIQL